MSGDSITLEAHLLQLTAAVGGYEIDIETKQETYVLGDEALECLKDIKQLLRLDDRTPEKNVQRLLGEWKFLQNDLVPIFTTQTGSAIVEAALELMVPLTWPVENSEYINELHALMKEYHLTLSKRAALDKMIEIFLQCLAKEKNERNHSDGEKVQLLLYLIRNMILIDNISEGGMFYVTLKECHVLELLLTFAGSMDDGWIRKWNFLLLEIIYLIVCPLEPEQLLNVKEELHVENGNRYVVQSNKPPDELLAEKQEKSKETDGKRKVTKKKMAEIAKLQYKPKQRELTSQELKIVDEFVDMFLSSSFNVLMGVIKKDLTAERQHLKDDDYTRFAMLSIFCLDYQRVKFIQAVENAKKMAKNEIEGINFPSMAVILDLEMLTFILKKIDSSREEKNLKSLELSVKLLTKWILIVEEMVASPVDDESVLAKGLQGNLFYREEELQILLSLVRNPLSTEKEFLEDMVEMIHFLIKFLEKHLKENKNMIVLRKTKRRKTNGEKEDEEVDQEHRRNVYKECKFEFGKIENRLSNAATLETYFELLKHADSLRKGTIHYVTKFFHRLFVKCDVDALMFKINYMYDFNIVLRRRRELCLKNVEFRELVEFIRHYVRTFLQKAKDHPTLFIDMFFSKTKGEWMEINGLFDDSPEREDKELALELTEQKVSSDRNDEVLITNPSNENIEPNNAVLPIEVGLKTYENGFL